MGRKPTWMPLLAAALALPACGGSDGAAGAPGSPGTPGTPGFLRLVGEQVVPAGGVASVDFTGLDGDSDGIYVLHGWVATTNYGPGGPYVTFTTSAADPSPVQGATVLTLAGGSSSGISNLDANAMNLMGPSFPAPSGFSGGCEMTVHARSSPGDRAILIRSALSLPDSAILAGRISGTGNLTAIHLKPVGLWAEGTRFRLYAYGP